MKVKFRSGLSFSMWTNETSSVTKLLFWNGADNYEYTRIFERLVQNAESFIDIGANTGYYTLLAATKNPAMRVFAFEPAAAPFYFLKKNIATNKLRNAHPYALALSDTAGEVRFFEMDNPENYPHRYNLAGTGTLKGDHLASLGYVARNVPALTLDEWLSSQSLSAVDIVKIDTEGTEHLILKGATGMLKNYRPIIICETLFDVIEKELEEIMSAFDYQFFNYKEGRLFSTLTLVRDTDNGFRDCFFVPSEKVDLISGFISDPKSDQR